jgi:hypothetical protein
MIYCDSSNGGGGGGGDDDDDYDDGVDSSLVQVQLSEGFGATSGRVEVFDGSSWGTVCDDGFTRDNAIVICRQLGFQTAIEPYFYTDSSYTDLPVVLDGVDCSGDESNIADCNHDYWGANDCSYSENVGVYCGEDSACQCESTTTITTSCGKLHAKKGSWCDLSYLDADSYCCGGANDCCKLSGGGIAVIVVSTVGGVAILVAACCITVACCMSKKAPAHQATQQPLTAVATPFQGSNQPITIGVGPGIMNTGPSTSSNPNAVIPQPYTPVPTAQMFSDPVKTNQSNPVSADSSSLLQALSNEPSEFVRETTATNAIRAMSTISLNDSRLIMKHFTMTSCKQPVLISLKRLLSTGDWEMLLSECVDSEFQRGLIREASKL